MPRTLLVLGLVLGLTAVATGAEDPTPVKRLAAARKEVAHAFAVLSEAESKVPNPSTMTADERARIERLWLTCVEKETAGFDVALEIAQADPRSEMAFDALEWVVGCCRYKRTQTTSALALLAQYHAANPKIRNVVVSVNSLAYFMSEFKQDEGARQAAALLRAVTETNPDRTTRGNAAFGLAKVALRDFRTAEVKAEEANDTLAVDAAASNAEKSLERVVRDFGSCPNLRKAPRDAATLGEQAKLDLYELQHLRVGALAPEVQGEDLNGTRFRLSESRGKVVLLVFWASWCGPCMHSVPHKRELVERFAQRPFVLIGVNGDVKKENALKCVEKHRINWRSFSGGRSIATAWNVDSWPRTYVIDGKGVIRHKWLRGQALDKPLEQLIAAVEAEANKEK